MNVHFYVYPIFIPLLLRVKSRVVCVYVCMDGVVLVLLLLLLLLLMMVCTECDVTFSLLLFYRDGRLLIFFHIKKQNE